MSWNSGAGSPVYFRCTRCRRSGGCGEGSCGGEHQVELTGRTRPTPLPTHQRSSLTTREYRCLCCGHVGWSNHRALERLAGDQGDRANQ